MAASYLRRQPLVDQESEEGCADILRLQLRKAFCVEPLGGLFRGCCVLRGPVGEDRAQ
jgi:hypothetical protein